MDVRQRRSQERLFATVIRLAEAGPVSRLNVSELAREAGVHRSTVYEFGAGPVDLLRQALIAELDALREGLPADPGDDVVPVVTQVTLGVLRHIESHGALYRRGLVSGEELGFRSMLGAHFLASSRLLLDRARVRIEVPVPGVDAEVVADLAIRMIADGTVGAIAGWLERPELTADDFMRAYVRLLPLWWPLSADPAIGREDSRP
jgi:AcrR family transcriptional regulator